MDSSSLKQYIENVFALESSVQSQENLISQLKSALYSLGQPNEDGPFKHEKVKIDKPRILPTLRLYLNGIGLPILAGFILAFVFLFITVLLMEFGQIEEIQGWSSSSNILVWGFRFSAVCIVLYMLLMILSIISERKAVDRKNRQIEEYNASVRQYNKQQERSQDIARANINNQLCRLDKSLAATYDILKKYYSLNIIHKKYRNFISISSFYEYFDTGRCSQLEGHEGAYNLFESELRLNHIMTSLDEISDKLDSIRHYQYALYRELKSANQKQGRVVSELQKMTEKFDTIADNTFTSSYNNEITRRNVELLTWFEITRF